MTFQQSQWWANCQISLPLSRLLFSQAIKIFLFTSTRPALPTDQLSRGEVSCCSLPVIRALQSQTLQKSCWKHKESPAWLRTTLEPWLNSPFLLLDRAANLLHHDCCQGTSVQKVLLKTLASLPTERHALPKNGLSSPRQGLPFLSLPQRRKTDLYFPNYLCRQSMLHNTSLVLSCIQNTSKPVDEQTKLYCHNWLQTAS